MPGAETPEKVRERLRAHALTLPESWVDHPWGETVVKVRKKIFLFLGGADDRYPPGFGVKLVASHESALALPHAEPSGYGLGRAGWVTVRIGPELPPVEVLFDWVEESYRAVAPKTLLAALDACRA